MPGEENEPVQYDAFISYSRTVDRNTATALEKCLKVFAKPLFKLRALRVFRDDASLTATPSLWAAIETALSRSSFFVLLASPQSAVSPWVRRELDWWLANRTPESLITVLTDGVIKWNHADTTSFPPQYFDKIPTEPRWVDLTWARKSTDLSLRNPDFLGAVAEIAGWIRGQSKDDLVGEDVSQHRRQRRYINAAIVLLAALASVATGAAIVAYQRSDEAVRASIAARAAEAQAQTERLSAESARDQERVARSRAEGAESDALKQRDVALAAREQEETARKRADDEKSRAEREKAQAFRNLGLAVETATNLSDSINEALAAQRTVPRQARLKALEASENALWALANKSDLQQVRRTVFTNSLEKISAGYYGLGARQESLRAWERVVELHRVIVKQQPRYLPFQSALGVSLVRLANHRLEVNDRSGHLKDLTEAVQMFRSLQTAPYFADPSIPQSIAEPAFRKLVSDNLAVFEAELRRVQPR